MNSNTDTWEEFVSHAFGGIFDDIVDRRFQSPFPPAPTEVGVRCYRLQFGAYDLASSRVGLENVSSQDAGYDSPGIRCGDFETFDKLGQEVDDAIKLIVDRHKCARVILVGHSRGGLSARAFLEEPSYSAEHAAVFGLVTTSSPHLGSRLGRIYDWLDTHRRGQPGTEEDDWEVVDFLKQAVIVIPGVPPSGAPMVITKTTLDVRRPVISDVADNSPALATLNGFANVHNLPSSIYYAEIAYNRADFGLLSTHPIRYSVFDQSGIGGVVLDQLSSDARNFILIGQNTDSEALRGDGLIPVTRQVFTHLPGYPGKTITRLKVEGREVVHTEAPAQYFDILTQLKRISAYWFPGDYE